MKMKKKEIEIPTIYEFRSLYNKFIEENEFVQHMGNCLNLML